jgi:hypothetical protein
MNESVKVSSIKLEIVSELGKYFKPHADRAHVCPGCGGDLWKVGISKIAYTNDVCRCREIENVQYDHVVDQAWHKTCLVKYLTEHPDKQKDYRYYWE